MHVCRAVPSPPPPTPDAPAPGPELKFFASPATGSEEPERGGTQIADDVSALGQKLTHPALVFSLSENRESSEGGFFPPGDPRGNRRILIRRCSSARADKRETGSLGCFRT